MYALTMTGKVQSDAAAVADGSALFQSIDLAFKATYAAAVGGAQPIAADDAHPFIPALGALTAVRALAVRAVDGQSLVVKLTSAAGTDQALPVSNMLLWRGNNAGDQVTAIKVVGSGRIEFLFAGDVS